MNRKTLLKIILLLLVISSILVSFENPQINEYLKNPLRIKQYIMQFEVLAPIAFVVLYTLRTLLFIFPVAVFAILSGSLFGVAAGFIYSMAGAYLSATVAFYIGRYLARDVVNKYLSEKLHILKSRKVKGFKIILILRLIMLTPYDVLSYVAGTSKITYKEFIAGNMLGIMPEFLIYAYLGNIGLSNDISLKEKLVISGVAISVLVVFVIIKKLFLEKTIRELIGKK